MTTASAAPSRPPDLRSSGADVLPIAVLVAVAFVAFAATNVDSGTLLLNVAVGTAATAVQIAVLMARYQQFTPLTLIPGLVNGVILLGAVVYDDIGTSAAVSARLPTNDESSIQAIQIALIFTTAVTIGGLFIRPREQSATSGSAANSVRPGVLFAVGLLPLALLVAGRGSALISAPGYGVSYGPVNAAIIGTALAPFAELALAIIIFQRRGALSFIATLGYVAWGLVHFAGATRQLALMPGILLAAYLLVGGSKKLSAAKLAAAGAATIYLSSLVLTFRSGPVGLRPLLGRLFGGDEAFVDPAATLGNLVFTTPLTAATAEGYDRAAPDNALGVSLSPLPGGTVGWPDVAPRLRINDFTPFNGLGELGGQGWVALVLYGVAVGLVLTAAYTVATGLPGAIGVAGRLAVIALVALFSITLLQYNLRSSTRLLYYLVLGIAGLAVVGRNLRSRAARSSRERRLDA